MLSYLDWSSPVEAIRRLGLFYRVRRHTLVSRLRLNALCDALVTIERERIQGALVECGVYKGGAAAIMAHETGNRRDLYLFDSFAGLPPPTAPDGVMAPMVYHDGFLASTQADVRAILRETGGWSPNVRIVPGWFHDTFPITTIPQIALLHIDADWYESVKLCLERWFDHVVSGGFVVIDDYGRWDGATTATDEFLRARRLPPLIHTGKAGHFMRVP